MANNDYTPRAGPTKEELEAMGLHEKEKKGWFW
jgi:hypothetical protein